MQLRISAVVGLVALHDARLLGRRRRLVVVVAVAVLGSFLALLRLGRRRDAGAVDDGLNGPALFATQWLSAALGHATIAAFYAPQQRKVFEQQRKLFEYSTADGGRCRAQSACVVCLQERPALAFLPCGHLAACMACAGRLGFVVGERPSKEDRCPVCRAPVIAWVRIYAT